MRIDLVCQRIVAALQIFNRKLLKLLLLFRFSVYRVMIWPISELKSATTKN